VIIYLAGPMTGYKEWNFPTFHAAAKHLRDRGHYVLNPAEMDIGIGFDPTSTELPVTDLAIMFRRDVMAVLMAEAVAVLEGWEKSSGATLEVGIARKIGTPVLWAHDLDQVVA
jgi:hypothetical protein